MTTPTQILYVLVSSNGDGSYSPVFTLDSELIEKLKQADRKGLMRPMATRALTGMDFIAPK